MRHIERSQKAERTFVEVTSRRHFVHPAIGLLTLVLSGIALAGCQTIPANPRVSQISPEELRAKLDHQDPLLLVFAYTRTYFAVARIEGAMPSEDLRASIPSLPRDVEIVLYCGCPHDKASYELATELRAVGFTHVKVLHGGIFAWLNAGYELAPPSRDLTAVSY